MPNGSPIIRRPGSSPTTATPFPWWGMRRWTSRSASTPWSTWKPRRWPAIWPSWSAVLKPDGVGFIHHSNYGTYQRSAHALAPLQSAFDRLPSPARAGLLRSGAYRGAHWRAPSVTAGGFVELCQRAGLHCVGQELVNWEGGVLLLDAMSVVTRPGSCWDRPNRVVKNRLFRMEARAIRRSAQVFEISSLSR